MRHVVSTDQVAHLWAHQAQDSARNPGRNFYFEGDTIYSYGRHFPIARIVQKKRGSAVLFTTRTYSVTTSKHLSYTSRAIPPTLPRFHVADVRDIPSKATMEEYRKRIDAEIAKGIASRKYADDHFGSAQALATEAQALATFFGLRCKAPTADVSPEALAKGKERAAKERKRQAVLDAQHKLANEERERKRAEAQAKLVAEAPRMLEQWRAGGSGMGYSLREIMNALDISGDLLRRVGDTVQTSKGAECPLTHVERAYKFLAALRAKGEAWARNGHTLHVGAFQIDAMELDGTIRAGCHRFVWKEVERFAKSQGW